MSASVLQNIHLTFLQLKSTTYESSLWKVSHGNFVRSKTQNLWALVRAALITNIIKPSTILSRLLNKCRAPSNVANVDSNEFRHPHNCTNSFPWQLYPRYKVILLKYIEIFEKIQNLTFVYLNILTMYTTVSNQVKYSTWIENNTSQCPMSTLSLKYKWNTEMVAFFFLINLHYNLANSSLPSIQFLSYKIDLANISKRVLPEMEKRPWQPPNTSCQLILRSISAICPLLQELKQLC